MTDLVHSGPQEAVIPTEQTDKPAAQREVQAVVVMHYDETGWLEVKIADPDGKVVVLTVDDRVPHDRVYEHLIRDDPADVLACAPRPWGNKDDDRHKQTEIKLHRLFNGLQVVSDDGVSA